MHKIRVKWIDDLNFVGTDSLGRATLISGKEGAGVSPMQMIALGLGGCAAYDIVNILKKQRQKLDDVEIELDAKRKEGYPSPYETIHMHFIVTGRSLDPNKVERAIKLSSEKYCGVHATIEEVTDISWDLEIRETHTNLITHTKKP